MIIDFNKDWTLIRENGESEKISLPHDAMLTEKRSAACRNGVQSGYFPGGKYRFEKKFDIDCADAKYELLFEGVYRNATVLVNGEKAAFHAYGYTEFTVDISAFIRRGGNTVTVIADNSLVPNCRWYSGSGVYRPVWLCINELPDPRIATVSYSPAVVEVSAETEIAIYDGGRLIANGVSGRFEIPDAKLWSAEAPYLYTCRANGKEIRFGIRTIEYSAETGLCINGERTLLRGGCIHHDNGVLGACAYRDAEYRRVKILKDQGFNALRISHNPASRALLDACDELGMYVIDECFDGWYIPKDYHDYSRQFMNNYSADLQSMVEKDVNHPCVIMYSIGNEVTETAEKKGIVLAAKMRDIIRALDDKRPVTCGVNVLLDIYTKLGMGVYKDRAEYKPEPLPENKQYREKKTGSAFFNAMAGRLGGLMFFLSKNALAEKLTADFAPSVDILGLNYAASRYDRDVEKYPERMMMGTETMVKDLPYNWERVKKHPQIIGDFVWAAWDYLGEACIGDWTYHSYKGLPLLAGQGMIDLTGKPLASMAFMQTVWGMRKEPFIAVSPLNHAGETPSTGAWQFTNAVDSWTWHGHEGKEARIEVYSDAPAVRLSLNGKAIGTKKLKNCRAKFKTAYEAGELCAAALDENGKEISRAYLRTGGKKVILTAKPEVYDELVFLPIEFTDENGKLLPYMEQQVRLEITGGKLLGFGSALCKTDEVFNKNYHDSYRGRCLAVIKPEGNCTVIAESTGVEPVTVEVCHA